MAVLHAHIIILAGCTVILLLKDDPTLIAKLIQRYPYIGCGNVLTFTFQFFNIYISNIYVRKGMTDAVPFSSSAKQSSLSRLFHAGANRE